MTPHSIRPDLIPLTGELSAVAGVVAAVRAAGGRALLVGGCVRDALMGRVPKDIDIECYGLEPRALEKALRSKFEINTVGRSFGVFKIKDAAIDVALPRRESKHGTGHTGFVVEGDPFMSIAEAGARRDFTVNAIYWDPVTGELLDPHGGIRDLESKVLRHTSPAFAEDPLRVLRAMQFLARFEFTAAPETVALCSRIDPENLPAERLFDEWQKLVVKGVKPSLGLAFLRECGWVRHYPELEALIGVEQDSQWHPEGDVWIHTLHCMDAFAKARTGDVWEDTVVGFAVLCHDFGKAVTTKKEKDGRWHAYGHEAAGESIAKAFLERLTRHKELVDSVLPLVVCHMMPLMLWRDKSGSAAIRRLARRVGRIDRLVRVDDADRRGRPPLDPGDSPQGAWLLERAAELRVTEGAPKRLVLGRHLIALGYKPGNEFTVILEEAYEAQLDGVFHDEPEGIAWLKKRMGEG
jgi:tRNA nucleotidyltransferase (CCA-adding enzyme)